jgi:Rhs element Vgr protein
MGATPSQDLLSIQLLINGNEVNAIVNSIEVIKGINKIAKASVVVNDGSKAQEDFKLSDSADFDPGNKIEIKAGYHLKEETIFKGIILSQAITIDSVEGPSLLIECKDEAFATTSIHKNAYFLNCTDSEIINKVLGSYPVSRSVDSTTVNYEEVIQYSATDWDFIVSRADINGLVTLTDDGTISIKKPDLDSTPVCTLNYGENIIELQLSVGSEDQFMAVDAIAWDASNQQLIQGKSQEPDTNSQGSITGKKLSDVLNANQLLQTTVALEKDALDSWANAQLLKSRLSRFQGTILCEGNASIKPNTLVEIKGIGKKINGNAYVAAVSHEINEGRWFTEITVGIQKNWFAGEVPVNPLQAAGRLPAMNGLQIGIVKKTYDDPSGEFRVLVTLPLIKDSDDGIWARLSTFYASKGFGNFFYPEVGDEVILGFLDDNPSAPIILGSVYSKTNAPALTPDEKNTHKSIISSTLMTIDFDEENKIITIKTPGNNIITLSDKDKGITLTDQNKNMIQLNEDGITIESKKDIIIKAANNISISGVNIDTKATNNSDTSANNVAVKAQMSYTAQAGASAELKASGNITVKGAVVSIN